MDKAIFLDRDGVINEMVYYPEHGLLDSPANADQMRVFPWAAEAINMLHDAGFKVILVSNQPGIAKGHFPRTVFETVRQRMIDELANGGATLDAEYYCFHHPAATIHELRADCQCRKPKPGLLVQAAKDMEIDLASSWMIGDGLTDIQAGKGVGCKTVLVGRMKCELCGLMDEMSARPDLIVLNLVEAASFAVQSVHSVDRVMRGQCPL